MTTESEAPRAAGSGDHVLKGGWYTLWVMLGLTLFGLIDRQVLTLAAAPMAATLNLSDAQLGMVQGLAFAIFAVVAVYPIAWAADRFDRRIVLGICTTIWSIGTAACGFARDFEELFLAAVLIAAGEAGLGPLAQSYIPELFKGRKRLLANGVNYVFGFLGISAALALGGGAIGALDAVHGDLPASLQAFESWRLAFFIVALPAPIFLILLAFTQLGRPRTGVQAPVNRKAASEPFWPFLVENRRAVATMFCGLGLYTLPIGGFQTWLAVVATRSFGTTPAQNGAAMGLAIAIGMIGGTVIGTLTVRRWIGTMGPIAAVRFFRIALIAALPVAIAFPFAASAWQLFALYTLVMLMATAVGCLLITVLQDMAPAPLRARMFAIWAIVYHGLYGAAPALVGWLSGALGSGPHMPVVAASLIAVPSWAAAALLLRYAERPFALLVARVIAMERGAS